MLLGRPVATEGTGIVVGSTEVPAHVTSVARSCARAAYCQMATAVVVSRLLASVTPKGGAGTKMEEVALKPGIVINLEDVVASGAADASLGGS